MAVVKTLTEDVGVRVGSIRGLAVELFRNCAQPWAGLERAVLIIDPQKQRVSVAPETQPFALSGMIVAVPLRPIVVSLRERLLLEQTDAQQEPLPFPPMAVNGDMRRSESHEFRPTYPQPNRENRLFGN